MATLQNVIDAGVVVSARLDLDQSGRRAVTGEHSYTDTWVCLTNTVLATVPQVLSSVRLPQAGDLYRRWEYQPNVAAWPGGDVVVDPHPGIYVPVGAAADPDAGVVYRDARRDDGNPLVWRVTVYYEAKGSDLGRPPAVAYTAVPYQEQMTVDARQRIVANSAGDPFVEGIARDRDRTRVVISRGVPYGAWDPLSAAEYRHTTNVYPWPLPGPRGPLYGFRGPNNVYTPLVAPSGCAKLSVLQADPVEVTANANPALSNWYWVVRAEVDIDLTRVFDPATKRLEYLRWRAAVADAGFHYLELTDTTPTRVYRKKLIVLDGGRPPATPQLLDGQGGKVPGIGPKPVPLAGGFAATGGPISLDAPFSVTDEYQTLKNTPLVIPAVTADLNMGVLANDAGKNLTAAKVTDPGNGTLTAFNDDGSFTYTPHLDYVGWDTFTYKAQNAVGDSAECTVIILVANTPNVLLFDRYDQRDWRPIMPWLGGW